MKSSSKHTPPPASDMTAPTNAKSRAEFVGLVLELVHRAKAAHAAAIARADAEFDAELKRIDDVTRRRAVASSAAKSGGSR